MGLELLQEVCQGKCLMHVYKLLRRALRKTSSGTRGCKSNLTVVCNINADGKSKFSGSCMADIKGRSGG